VGAAHFYVRWPVEAHEYTLLEKLSDRELFDFVTEKDNSQRKWAAMHLLELRRNEALTKAAKSSANAAWLAAIIAGISAAVAVFALLWGAK
jgi:hypothetical protein